MPDPDSASGLQRDLDERAVRAALRRLARAAGAPWLHREVARRMAERLAIVKLQPTTVLDWWSFVGGGADALANAYPKARRIAVEPDEVLQRLGRSKPGWWSRRSRRHDRVGESDVRAGEAGLVWANMMLHAVRDPLRLMTRWQAALGGDGFLMFSCLGPDSLKELRQLYAARSWPAPHADFVDMHDLGDMLLRAGFAAPVMDQEQITLDWCSPAALLDELRGLGANVSPRRFRALRTPRWRLALQEAVDSRAGPDGRARLTFEIVYGHAFKAAPRATASAITTVPLDEMRSIMRSRRERSGG